MEITYVYSCFNYSYFHKASVLAATLKKFHSSWKFIAVIVERRDSLEPSVLENRNFDEIIFPETLLGSSHEKWFKSHSVVEACTSIKGVALQTILVREDCKNVFYFDPDIAIINNLTSIEGRFRTHDIILTPHQTKYEAYTDIRAIIDNEVGSLAHGCYNLGFLGIKKSKIGKEFASWWATRLLRFCFDDKNRGLFVDQKWIDLVPSLFEGVCILKDQGCNVASWNLSTRKLSFNDKHEIQVNNSAPLLFYHFSKLGKIADVMTMRYAAGNILVYELWDWYKNLVEQYYQSEIVGLDWTLNYDSNGKFLTPEQKVKYKNFFFPY